MINKYIWLIGVLNTAGERGLTLSELDDKWRRERYGPNEFGEPLARQTFCRWRDGISSTFGLEIRCHRSGGFRYYISNLESLEQGELSRWLLDTYATANTLAESAALRERIITEDIPSGREHLTEIIRAMKDNKVIEMEYRSFWSDHTKTHIVEPYSIRLVQKRWYLLARSVQYGKLLNFGLDRIENLHVTDQTFRLPEKFNAKEFYSTFFGAVLDDEIPVHRIVLRVYEPHLNYIRALPLHDSQREIRTEDGFSDFELRLRPTYDFGMELMEANAMIEVLEPQSLRAQMRQMSRDLWALYKDDPEPEDSGADLSQDVDNNENPRVDPSQEPGNEDNKV